MYFEAEISMLVNPPVPFAFARRPSPDSGTEQVKREREAGTGGEGPASGVSASELGEGAGSRRCGEVAGSVRDGDAAAPWAAGKGGGAWVATGGGKGKVGGKEAGGQGRRGGGGGG